MLRTQSPTMRIATLDAMWRSAVTLVRSGINRKQVHKDTIKRLGLRKLHSTVVLPDNLAVRGMIRSVSHMVKVESGDLG